MPGKVDKKLTALVNKFFSPTATLFDKQEAIIGFMAHLRFPSDKAARELVFALYDSQYKSAYILKHGLDDAMINGLDIDNFCENVFNSTFSAATGSDLNIFDAEDFHNKSMICADISEFIMSYYISFGAKSSIKKAHYFFKRYAFERNDFVHAYAWRVFNRNWVSYKNVCFYLLANIDTDDLLNFGMLEKTVLDAVAPILAAPERFAVFLRKSRYIFDELERALDGRATAGFSFPALPPSFSPMAIHLNPIEGEALDYMRRYKSLAYD